MNKNRSRNRKSLGDLISNIKYAAGGMVDPVEAWYRQKDQYKAVPSPQDVLAKESENFAQSVRSLENDPDIQKHEMAQGAMDMVAALGAEATNQISPKAGKWLSAGMQGWKALTAGDYMGYAQGGQIQNGEAMEGQQAFTPQDFEGMNQGFTMPDESMGSQGMGMEGQQEMGMDPQQARQFLMEHVQEIGLDPSQIEQMSDEEVVQLAQQVMQELQQSEGRESPDEMEGGEEIPEGGEEAMQPNMGTPYGSADEMNQLFAQGGQVYEPKIPAVYENDAIEKNRAYFWKHFGNAASPEVRSLAPYFFEYVMENGGFIDEETGKPRPINPDITLNGNNPLLSLLAQLYMRNYNTPQKKLNPKLVDVMEKALPAKKLVDIVNREFKFRNEAPEVFNGAANKQSMLKSAEFAAASAVRDLATSLESLNDGYYNTAAQYLEDRSYDVNKGYDFTLVENPSKDFTPTKPTSGVLVEFLPTMSRVNQITYKKNLETGKYGKRDETQTMPTGEVVTYAMERDPDYFINNYDESSFMQYSLGERPEEPKGQKNQKLKGSPKMAAGGNVPVEVEGGEIYETPEGDVGQFHGPSHEEGGIPTELPQGTSIYSVRNGVGNNTMADRKKSRERRYNSALAAVQRNPTDPIARKTLSRILQVNQQQDAQDMAIQNTMHQIDELKAQLEQLLLNSKKKVASDEGGDEKQNGRTFATGGWLYNPIDAEEEKKKEETKQARAEKITPLANNTSWQELYNSPSYQNAVKRYKDSFMQKQQQDMMKDAQRENRLGSPSSFWDDVKGAFKKVKDTVGNKDYSTLIPTAGEALQQYARGRGIREKWRNLQMAQASTPTNRNFYENYGNRSIAEIDRGKQYIQDTLNQQLDELRYAKDAQQIRNRDSASGINQLRALDALNDLDYSRKVQQAKLQADISMSQLNQAQANNYNNQDQIRMTGATNADTANRRDTDNYFTQRDKMIDDTTRMIDQVGQYLNQKVADYRTNNAINSAAKYGQRINQSGEMEDGDQAVEGVQNLAGSQMASEPKKSISEAAQKMLYNIESGNPDWKNIQGVTPVTMNMANNMRKTALGLATMKSAVAKVYAKNGWRMGNLNEEQVAKTYAYMKDVLGII